MWRIFSDRTATTTTRRPLQETLALMLVACLWTGSVAADAYRLVPGDQLRISVYAENEDIAAAVDIDGSIRLRGAGSVTVEGLTLDEAEAAVNARMRDSGLFVSPNATLSVTAYAPVLVFGDVRGPGAFEFRPNMTAGMVAGLAGGATSLLFDPQQLEMTRATLTADLRAVDADIAFSLIRKARIEAALAGSQTLSLDDVARERLTRTDRAYVEQVLASETTLLREDLESHERVRVSLQRERQEILRQSELLDQRLVVQDRIVALQQEALEAAERLEERGLQTRGGRANIERLGGDAQARLLEVQSALAEARIDLVAIELEIDNHDSRRISELQDALSTETLALQRHSDERRKILDRLVVVADGSRTELLTLDTLQVDYLIQRRQDGALVRLPAQADDPVWPGDSVIVSLSTNTTEPGMN